MAGGLGRTVVFCVADDADDAPGSYDCGVGYCEGVADGVAVGEVTVGEGLVDDDCLERGVGIGRVDGAAAEERDA